MNRRNFLKSLAIVCGAAVVCPGELLKKRRHPGIDKIPEHIMWMRGKDGSCIEGEKTRWPKYHAEHNLTSKQKGVTEAQLRELIQVTLKDLPKDCMRVSFSGMDYTLCRNDKGEYYPGGYGFNR